MNPLCGHEDRIVSIAISRKNRYIVSASEDGTVRIWDMSNGKEVREPLRGHSSHLNSVAVSEDCQVIVSVSDNYTVLVWNVSKKLATTVLRGHAEAVSCVVLSSDNSRVVSGSWDKTVRIWNLLDTKNEVSTAEKKEDRLATALCVSIDREVVAVGYGDGGISIRNVETERTEEIRLPGIGVGSIAVSSDKQYIVSGSVGASVYIWNVTTGRLVRLGHALCSYGSYVRAVAISHDCRWFVFASPDKTLSLWELPSGKAIGEPLVGHTSTVICVAISSDDRFVVSGSKDGRIMVWDASSGRTIVKPLIHDWTVESVHISRDNQQIISMDWTRKVYVWKVSTGELLESATDGPNCARLLWKAKEGWNGGEEARVESGKRKPQITIADQDVCICEPTRNRSLFEKVGQFDAVVKDWVVDAKWVLWTRLLNRRIARLEIVTGSSSG